MPDNDEISFLPTDLRTDSPDFLVWWTGTLGQAEWLITFSPTLRGRAAAKECPKSLAGIPSLMRPLLALEQPDLIVTYPDGKAIISIEITEQQEFGLNAQQRMARFWSAVACRVPSAYLLPVESYQIEKASAALASILDDSDKARQEVFASAAVIPDLRGASLWRAGVRSRADLISQIERGGRAISTKARAKVSAFWAKHVLRTTKIKHIPAIPYDEHLHRIDKQTYKAYLRPTGMPTAMLLEWMRRCSERVPTFPFKMQSELRDLFRTNGVTHILEDKENPHLSFRNLPPAPGTSEVVNSSIAKDEMTLFIDFVEAVLNDKPAENLGREMFTADDEYFSSADRSKWRDSSLNATELLTASSGDYMLPQAEIRTLAASLEATSVDKWTEGVSNSVKSVISSHRDFHIYKISNSAVRGLSDPYSGALAVRDILFCRRDLSGDLMAFKRSSGLMFMVDFTGLAAESHSFLYAALQQQYQRFVHGGKTRDPQKQLTEISHLARIDQIPKDLRCHLLFSDLIIVRRFAKSGVVVEALVGLAGLRKLGVIDRGNVMIESVTG